MKFVADMTLLALHELGIAPLPLYEDLLLKSMDAHPVPFGQRWYGDAYRKRARDPMWFVHSLVANASKESEGSRQLWKIAARTADPDIAVQIRSHAIDEARHARFYLLMAKLTFPDAADDMKWGELMADTPRYTRHNVPEPSEPNHFSVTLDELIQTNIGEIRTRIHQLLLRSVIVLHCEPSVRARLEKIVDSVLFDETRHIAYTAAIIDKAMRDGHDRLVREIMFERLAEFNALTLVEVDADTYDGACGHLASEHVPVAEKSTAWQHNA
ncbi:hypothetical protein ACFFJT_18315 [Dyella flava]|uniref:p-aminobenzoate N-oxygenase AurF n=1 Tax=Dyella flava TaxID=1920170 RepID=A0ABS2JZM4_9GAMM|nr:hypothetical protein [Dyella flava]MBM7124443.1 hypothetical protein [Dyella flava]GLQ51895.1 hypothetical protein GCM10010872_33440 [Dyella flava]